MRPTKISELPFSTTLLSSDECLIPIFETVGSNLGHPVRQTTLKEIAKLICSEVAKNKKVILNMRRLNDDILFERFNNSGNYYIISYFV